MHFRFRCTLASFGPARWSSEARRSSEATLCGRAGKSETVELSETTQSSKARRSSTKELPRHQKGLFGLIDGLLRRGYLCCAYYLHRSWSASSPHGSGLPRSASFGSLLNALRPRFDRSRKVGSRCAWPRCVIVRCLCLGSLVDPNLADVFIAACFCI